MAKEFYNFRIEMTLTAMSENGNEAMKEVLAAVSAIGMEWGHKWQFAPNIHLIEKLTHRELVVKKMKEVNGG